ncbi:hypothetical protein SNEBB_004205 [Seison nebaliae]|nr:hypothetical protein SNEBB_004205 [Seison nebaliae]
MCETRIRECKQIPKASDYLSCWHISNCRSFVIQSPQRRKLLEDQNLKFSIIPSNIDEDEILTSYQFDRKEEYIEKIAEKKLEHLINEKIEADIIICGDTCIIHDNEVIGKPKNEKDAENILKRLSGNKHSVYTSVVIATNKTLTCKQFVQTDSTIFDYKNYYIMKLNDKVEVTFLPLNEQSILSYIRTGIPLNKAGAYDLQGMAISFVSRIVGNPSTVIGLPVHLIGEYLCRLFLNYIH